MVRNTILDYVKEELGNSTAAYISDLPEEEAKRFFDEFAYDTDLQEYDALILHASPSEPENELRYDLFEKAAFYLHTLNRNPNLFVPEKFRNNVSNSEIVHENSVKFIDPIITEDELKQPYKSFSGEGRIHITSDYHAEGVDYLSNMFDEDDYVVFSADTSNQNFPKEKYTEKLGDFQLLADRLPMNWRFWAEGKEVGRKTIDSVRGPRF